MQPYTECGSPNICVKLCKATYRILVYGTNQGRMSITVTAGVPLGSILGSTLWNMMYDRVLALTLPNGVEIVGFVDDVILAITGETADEVRMLMEESLDIIES